jgi:hypothetical protein
MWRRLAGTADITEATDDELRASSASGEQWETRCVWAVIGGLVLEAALAFWHPPYGSMLGRWGVFTTDAMIALGVFGELRLSHRVRVLQGELDRRSSERLAEAALEVELLRAQIELMRSSTICIW